MALELSDYVIIGILLAAFIVYLYIYTDALAMHVKINSSYDKFKAAWDKEHNQKVNSTSTTVTTTLETTTSTLVAYVMQTGGSPSLLFKTSRGDLLFDCGSNVSLMDKLYAGGVTGLKAAFISALDSEHAGACSRLFMSVPVSMVFDSMEGTNASWYKDYVFSLTSKRYNMSKSSYSEGGLHIDVLLRNRSSTFYHFTFGNFSLAYLGGCGKDCIGGYLNKSYGVYIVDDDVISDDLMVKYMPKGVIVPGYGNETIGIARKYGIQGHSMRKDGDMMLTSDGTSVKIG